MMLKYSWTLAVAVAALIGAMESPLLATTQVVPEIDASSMSVGLGLLAGGVLVLRARMRR